MKKTFVLGRGCNFVVDSALKTDADELIMLYISVNDNRFNTYCVCVCHIKM